MRRWQTAHFASLAVLFHQLPDGEPVGGGHSSSGSVGTPFGGCGNRSPSRTSLIQLPRKKWGRSLPTGRIAWPASSPGPSICSAVLLHAIQTEPAVTLGAVAVDGVARLTLRDRDLVRLESHNAGPTSSLSERVIGVQDVEHRAVVLQQVGEESNRLFIHGAAQGRRRWESAVRSSRPDARSRECVATGSRTRWPAGGVLAFLQYGGRICMTEHIRVVQAGRPRPACLSSASGCDDQRK